MNCNYLCSNYRDLMTTLVIKINETIELTYEHLRGLTNI